MARLDPGEVPRAGVETTAAVGGVRWRDLRKGLLGKVRTVGASALGLDGYTEHEIVARTVFRNLKLRHAQLWAITALTKHSSDNLRLREVPGVDLNGTSEEMPDEVSPAADQTSVEKLGLRPGKSGGDERSGAVDRIRANALAANFLQLRNYHLAATDIFVEKAIEYLDRQARPYKAFGILANLGALVVILIGMVSAGWAWSTQLRTTPVDAGAEPYTFLHNFLLGFTYFGMVVLLAVGLRRFGRALLDQAERLSERKHALRQGRLFVHLNDGILTVEEMETIFHWNVSGANAFGSMQTEDQAPSGAAVREFARNASKFAEALQAAAKRKE